MKTIRYVPVIVITLLVLLVAPVTALTQGFKTTDDLLVPGMAVALKQGDNQAVERASQENEQYIIGIAVTGKESPAIVTSKDQQVFVETSGVAEVYVTDSNGTPGRGTKLAISPFRGVLMAMGNEGGSVIGTSEQDFSEVSNKELKQLNGKDVIIAKMKVNLDYKDSVGSGIFDGNQSALRKLGRSVVGKEVPAIRVAFALILFLVVLLAEGGIIYGAVSGAMTALGRNPLARKLIHQETAKVVGIAVVVLLFGTGAVYLLLWI